MTIIDHCLPIVRGENKTVSAMAAYWGAKHNQSTATLSPPKGEPWRLAAYQAQRHTSTGIHTMHIQAVKWLVAKHGQP